MKNIAHLSDDLETKAFAFIDIHVFPSSGRGGEKHTVLDLHTLCQGCSNGMDIAKATEEGFPACNGKRSGWRHPLH